MERLKKSVAELQVARSASEAQHTDLAERYLRTISGAPGGAQRLRGPAHRPSRKVIKDY